MRYDKIVALLHDRLARATGGVTAIVAAPSSREILSSLCDALDAGFLSLVQLVGNPAAIPFSNAAEQARFEVVPALLEAAIAAKVTELAAGQGRTIVVKGRISSSTLLGAVLAAGRAQRRISHIYVIDSSAFPDRAIIITDAGVNIRPDLAQKVEIIENAIALARQIACETPRVALLSAIEYVNPSMQSSVEAATLKAMGESGRFPGSFIEGPLALDAAMMPEAAAAKSLYGEVAGRADILVAPDIESGNCTAKALIGATGRAMGVIYGAAVPIAFPSRGDSQATRLDSLMLAAALAEPYQKEEQAA